ncbi:MAG: rRNA pseudouridine synthase [Caulobacteraceae bacterium]|nr:rRNA pseudouridine synthase [Caulobacteraceae bacterium]
MVDHRPPRTGRGAEGQDAAPGERVAKRLARAGVASRREVERLIGAGLVTINGEVLTSPARNIAPTDIVVVDGRPVGAAEPTRLFRYHKPPGLVTSHNDLRGRPTVFEALPKGLPRLISVGRLDISSEGLLLLTNDGGLARALELPATGLRRQYRARARGHIDQARLDALKDGITVEGVRYGPIEARLDKARPGGASAANLWISLALTEGKNREVRRVLEALGLTVNRLLRLAYGPFALGHLPRGAVEEVGPRVLREQLGEWIAPANLPNGDRPSFQGPPIESRRSARGMAPVASVKPDRPTYKPGWARPKRGSATAKRRGRAPAPGTPGRA